MRHDLSKTTILAAFLLAACSDDGSGDGAGSGDTESGTGESDSDSNSDSASASDSAEAGSNTASGSDTTPGDGDGDDSASASASDSSPGDGDGDDSASASDSNPGDGDGDDSASASDSAPGDGDGDSGTGDGDGDGGSGDGDGDGNSAPAWLLSIDNPSDMLQKVDIFTGETEDLCQLQTNNSYPSLTFSRANTLYASRGGTALDVIDPCTCEITPVGGYGGYSGVNGITADNGIDLRGIATTQDDTIEIDTGTGMAALIGPLGANFGTTGATWTDEFDGMWAINGNDDWLYQVDVETGMASQHVQLNYNFGTVGIELSPYDNEIYACSSAGELLRVDPDTGMVEIIGDMGNAGSCTNLAAPFEPVDCVGD